ncbi:hypothetical protein [Oligoflexus tunisiensis]|uniref:hypothetical protein n=1 Tax=Oligoflexus tunisiensis TaxID=708132 RepID=UPI001C4056F0|nr:hypothetical protein [Oligoflexus tunisiensis]
MSFLYSFKVLGQEVRRQQTVMQALGGNQQQRMEQTLRLSMAALFTALALLSMLVSGALIWL